MADGGLGKYSQGILGTYDRERHILLEDALAMIERESHLDSSKLTYAIGAGEIQAYDFKGGRYLTDGKINPYDTVGSYTKRDLELKNTKGEIVFQMDDAEFPASWDDNNATVVAKTYFYKPNDATQQDNLRAKIGNDHEYSLRHLVTRVTNFFADEGWRLGYFKTEEDREAFRDDLAYLQINRMGAFNTPVQINAGLYNEYGVKGSSKNVYWRNSETGKV